MRVLVSGFSRLGKIVHRPGSVLRYDFSFEIFFAQTVGGVTIAEVCEPTRIPEEYSLNSVDALCLPDGTLWHLSAAYTNGTKFLHLDIESYQGEPKSQIEKTDTPVEVFSVEDITVYLFQNSINNVAAWATEHYEYTVSGPVEKSELKQIVLSAQANVQ